MAIWGESYPKIKKADDTEITLGHSIIRPTWQEPNVIEHRSIINGVRSYVKISENFASFEVVMNMWKFGDPEAKMWEVMRENHTTIKFMPHQDSGNYLKTAGAVEATFYIVKMIPYYLNTEPPLLQDKLLITFKSLVYVDILADFSEVPAGAIQDDLGDVIKDDLDDVIKEGN